MERAHDVELQESRRKAWRGGEHAIELADAERNRRYGNDQNADQDRTANLERIQNSDDEETCDSEQRTGFGQITKADERCFIVNHDASSFQADERQEHADTGCNRASKRMRNAFHQPAADTRYRQKKEDDAGNENRTERLLPAEAHGSNDREREECVEAHAGRHADRPVGDKRHDDRAERSGETGRHENRAFIHARGGQDIRVDKDDVRHRQEGRHAGDDFRPRVGAVFL